MKIYTITCHNVYNHGAILQAYALMTYLQQQGHEVEIIDYQPSYLNNHYKLFRIDHPRWNKNWLWRLIYLMVKLPGRIWGLKRKIAFDRFREKYLVLTKDCYSSNTELKKRLPKADVYICGSDQIWNSTFPNGRDPAFYLDFAPKEKRKLSYAASFATDYIPEEIVPFVKEKLCYLDHISVREQSGVSLVRQLKIGNVKHVVDPTFLLSKEHWNNLARSMKEPKKKYILVYDFDHSPILKNIAMEIAYKTGYSIYSVNPNKINFADKYFKFVGPDTFLALIRNASFVVSNSYHALIFSLIYEKNFAIVKRMESINTRMRDLLKELHLSDRLIDDSYDIKDLLKPVDYKVCKPKINKKIEDSKQFLKDHMMKEDPIKGLYEEKTIICH